VSVPVGLAMLALGRRNSYTEHAASTSLRLSTVSVSTTTTEFIPLAMDRFTAASPQAIPLATDRSTAAPPEAIPLIMDAPTAASHQARQPVSSAGDLPLELAMPTKSPHDAQPQTRQPVSLAGDRPIDMVVPTKSPHDAKPMPLSMDRPLMVMPTTAYPHAPQPVQWITEGLSYVKKSEGPRLFCWAVVMSAGVEQWLMVTQLHRGTGIFGCHNYSVFSDKALSLGPGPDGWGVVDTIAIPGEPASQARLPGSDALVWHNTNVFLRAYRKIEQDGIYRSCDWTVKVDPDTAFIPGILQRKLREQQRDGSDMVYFANCRKWNSMQGPLELISHAAAERFYSNHHECLDALQWQHSGEDWFVGKCLELLGASRMEGFDMLDDGWCQDLYADTSHDYGAELEKHGTVCNDGKPAYHPMKTTEHMIACVEQAAPLNRVVVPVEMK